MDKRSPSQSIARPAFNPAHSCPVECKYLRLCIPTAWKITRKLSEEVTGEPRSDKCYNHPTGHLRPTIAVQSLPFSCVCVFLSLHNHVSKWNRSDHVNFCSPKWYACSSSTCGFRPPANVTQLCSMPRSTVSWCGCLRMFYSVCSSYGYSDPQSRPCHGTGGCNTCVHN